jgi:hypothetical protein
MVNGLRGFPSDALDQLKLLGNPQVTRNALTDTWAVIDSYRLILVGKAGATLSADSTLLTALPSALLRDAPLGVARGR